MENRSRDNSRKTDEKYTSYQEMLMKRLKKHEGIHECVSRDYFTTLERCSPVRENKQVVYQPSGEGIKIKRPDWKSINKFNEIKAWNIGQSFVEDHFLPEIREAEGDRLPGLEKGIKLLDMITDNYEQIPDRSKSETKASQSSSFLTVDRTRAKMIDHKLALFIKNKTAGLMQGAPVGRYDPKYKCISYQNTSLNQS